MPARLVVACIASALALSAGALGAQQRPVRGIVVDSAGAPIAEAAVAIVEQRLAARTDRLGRFSFDRVRLGDVQVSVRHLGHEPRTVKTVLTEAGEDPLRIVLADLPEIMAGITVSATAQHQRQMVEDFYWRRARGIGKFIAREEILTRRASTPSELFRNTPGVRLVRTISGAGIRFSAVQTMRNAQCIPLIWLDGQRSPNREIDEIAIGDIEGIELYSGASTTPPQFWIGTAAHCGTIVIWTRVPGTP